MDTARPGRARRRGPAPFDVGALGVAIAVGAAMGWWWVVPAPSDGGRAVTAAGLPARDCAGADPWLVTTLFSRGQTFDAEPAVVAFHDSPDDDERAHVELADQRHVGTTYGVAYDPYRDAVYVGAYHTRNTAFGPLGPGGIYRVPLGGGQAEPLGRVPDAGRDEHDRDGNYQPDERGRSVAMKTGLGDIDLDPAGRVLYAMNLAARRIDRLDAATGAPIDSVPHGAAAEPWAADARPFALAVHDGMLFHGVVDSAERSRDAADLAAYVYRSSLDGSAMREVARVPLDYPRGKHPRWKPWPQNDDRGYQTKEYPHPVLSDIEFDARGRMLLGLRDRWVDTGPSLTEYYRVASGDLLRLEPDGAGRWMLAPGAHDDYGGDDLPPIHDEIVLGGLAELPGPDVVVATAIDPIRGNPFGTNIGAVSAGAVWFDNGTGRDRAREELVYNARAHAGPQGKAMGLGDLELLCGERIATATPTAPASPTPTPTDTAPALTATPSAPPTSTPAPSATPTPTVTATSTPDHFTIYLPEGQTICVPKRQYVDVVLVLDRSTSMLRPVVEGGLPKNEAAIDAAKAFVGLLQLAPDPLGRHDDVAIVGFNDTAWTELGLSSDRVAALAALDDLRMKTAEGTRLDLALIEGQRPLDGPGRRPENLPVLILLTDGLPNRVPTPTPSGRQEDTVLAAATAAKARGTVVFTIALGATRDIYPRLMIAAASEPWAYYYAPRPEDLAGIYAQIADVVVYCDRPKPTRPTPCAPEFVHADAALVLDMSTSMYRTTRAGRTKHAAAIEAAKAFVRKLDFEPDGWGRQDTAAVLGFNDTAWTELAFADRPPAIEAALDRLLLRIAEGRASTSRWARAGAAVERGRGRAATARR
ncbi:MAG: vWA domain-containing protein [Anaerolineae bacterium]